MREPGVGTEAASLGTPPVKLGSTLSTVWALMYSDLKGSNRNRAGGKEQRTEMGRDSNCRFIPQDGAGQNLELETAGPWALCPGKGAGWEARSWD